jgi:hypothetical protein
MELSIALVASRLIRSLWELARYRYVGWRLPRQGAETFVPGASVEDVMSISEDHKVSGYSITEVTFPPIVHTPPGSGTDLLIDELDA